MEYVAFSGGCDSTATALLLKDQGKDFQLIFADTGAELPETYWFMPRFARAIGKKLIVLSHGTFYQHLVNFGFFLPSMRARWCTKYLKIYANNKFYKPEDNVNYGIRGDEIHRARIKEPHEVSYPLVEAGMFKKDVLNLCRRHDALNPIYTWRSSCSCFCCPFQRIRDWRGLFKKHPDLYALAEEWEEQSFLRSNGFGWIGRKGRSLKDLRIVLITDERQLELFPEPEDMPCVICSY